MNRRSILAGGAALTAPNLSHASTPRDPTVSPYPVETRTGPRGSTHYAPAGIASAPAVLLLHGSEGGNSRWSHVTAIFLATQGFVAAPFPYSRGGNIHHAGDIVEVELDETAEALRLLRAHEGVSGAVGLWGISRGAEHALLLTSLMASEGDTDLPGAVAVHAPSDVIVPGFVAAHYVPNYRSRVDLSKPAWRWRGTPLESGTPIEVERYAGPLLLGHGEEDPVWPADRTRRLEARLRAAGRTPEVHYYPGEGHGLRPAAANLDRARLSAFFRRHLA